MYWPILFFKLNGHAINLISTKSWDWNTRVLFLIFRAPIFRDNRKKIFQQLSWEANKQRMLSTVNSNNVFITQQDDEQIASSCKHASCSFSQKQNDGKSFRSMSITKCLSISSSMLFTTDVATSSNVSNEFRGSRNHVKNIIKRPLYCAKSHLYIF